MPKSGEITYVLRDGTDVFIDPQEDGIYHIRYIMPNGLPNVVLWSADGKEETFIDSNAAEAITILKEQFTK
jgi:hypothetical protein